MPEAFRDASLLAISDLVIEPVEIAANLPGVERSPLARFKARYGNRLHSVAWYVDNLEGAFKGCRERGVRMTEVTGRSVEDLDHVGRSEERREGKEWGHTGRSRWSQSS